MGKFHKNCITNWYNSGAANSKKCPCCRQKIQMDADGNFKAPGVSSRVDPAPVEAVVAQNPEHNSVEDTCCDKEATKSCAKDVGKGALIVAGAAGVAIGCQAVMASQCAPDKVLYGCNYQNFVHPDIVYNPHSVAGEFNCGACVVTGAGAVCGGLATMCGTDRC